MKPKFINYTNEDRRHRKANYICECGKIFNARFDHVNNGGIRSCGCVRVKLSAERKIKHNESSKKTISSEYTCWASIKQRCYDEKSKSYKNYGKRGIIMSDDWFNSFEIFLEDMGRKPGKEYSIDRIDVNGNYTKENCKWVTAKEQHRNKRNTIYIEYKGERKSLCDWCDQLNISKSRTRTRIRRGWSVEKALTF